MWFQQVVGVYYVLVDIILVGQYFYFSAYPPVLLASSPTLPSLPPAKKTRAFSSQLVSSLIITLSLLTTLTTATPPHPPPTPTERLGTYLSWTSTILYLTSRLPQILLNLRRKSTDGLAITLFVAAFFGNLFYALSLACNPLGHGDFPPWGGGGVAGGEGSGMGEWWGRSAPFFIGAAGVLGLDAVVGWQWVLWGEGGGQGGFGGFGEGWAPWGGWFCEEERGLLGEEGEGGKRYGGLGR